MILLNFTFSQAVQNMEPRKILSHMASNGRVAGIDLQPHRAQQIYGGHFSAVGPSRNLCYDRLKI